MGSGSPLTIGLISAAVALVSAYFAFRSSSAANRTADRKVDLEAFDRSQAVYDKIVERLQAQVDRATEQITRLNEQVAREQELSSSLRNQIRTLQAQIDGMTQTIADLRAQLAVTRP